MFARLLIHFCSLHRTTPKIEKYSILSVLLQRYACRYVYWHNICNELLGRNNALIISRTLSVNAAAT